MQGILVDKMCSAAVVQKGFEAAKMHTKDCALMPNCAAGGYGVVTADGRFLKFDPSGDKQASAALEATAKKENLTVTVEGEISDNMITVENLRII